MKTKITLHIINNFQVYNILLTCLLVVGINSCFGTWLNEATCTPNKDGVGEFNGEFKPYIFDPNFVPEKGVKINGLCQGIYASGQIQKPNTIWIDSMVNVKTPDVIKYNENYIISYIKSWFSIESWYNWYNKELIDTQETKQPNLPDIVREAIPKPKASVHQEIPKEANEQQVQTCGSALNETLIREKETAELFGLTYDQYKAESSYIRNYMLQLATIQAQLKLVGDPIQLVNCAPSSNLYYKIFNMIYDDPELMSAVESNNMGSELIANTLIKFSTLAKDGNILARHFVAMVFREQFINHKPGNDGAALYMHIIKDLGG